MELWGEIPAKRTPKTYLESIEQDSVTEFLPFQVDNEHNEPECSELESPKPVLPKRTYKYSLNPPIVQHTIEVIKYSKELKSAVDQMEKYADKKDDECIEIPQIPDFPEFPENYPFGIGSTEHSASGSTHKDMKPVMLCQEDVRKILMKSIAAIFCQAGYDDAPEGILFLLRDIVEDYFTGLMKLLRRNVERGMISRDLDVVGLETTFHGMGMPNLTELQKYFQNVFQVHDRLLTRSKDLLDKYKAYSHPGKESK